MTEIQWKKLGDRCDLSLQGSLIRQYSRKTPHCPESTGDAPSFNYNYSVMRTMHTSCLQLHKIQGMYNAQPHVYIHAFTHTVHIAATHFVSTIHTYVCM